MSTDPSGIIYYGIKLGEEWGKEGEEGYYEITEKWEKEHRPSMPEEPGPTTVYKSAVWDGWRARLREWEKSAQHVEATWSGSESCETFYVHSASLQMTVDWNEQIEIPDLKQPQPEADEWIKKFCDQFGLPYSQPKWYLACRYF